jgi:uncharacterized protein DUF3489
LILGEEKGPAVDQIVSKDSILFTGDRWFESVFLQQGVYREPVRDYARSMVIGTNWRFPPEIIQHAIWRPRRAGSWPARPILWSGKSLSRRTFRSTSPAREALLSMSAAPSWVATRLAPRAGLVVVQASRWAMPIQRTKTMASRQPRKQTKSGAKVDTGEANKPAGNRQRAPRRRVSKARSGSAATETSSAAAQAGVAPEGASESIDLSKNTTRSPGDQSSQSKPPSEGADLPTVNVPGADADRPRASTKRAVLIGMLERPDGASVAELGQRLGWLPHTVRAAITGLRHAGREVTRSKDAEGQSVYRLARPETVGR